MTRGVWVSHLIISKATAVKIDAKHGIEVAEIRDAVVCVKGLRYRWDRDQVRGERAIVAVTIRNKPAKMVLYPVDGTDGTWALGSVYLTS